jgi:hypothetical protein
MKGNVYGILVGKLENIDDLEDLEIDGSIILKLALEKYVGDMDRIHLAE